MKNCALGRNRFTASQLAQAIGLTPTRIRARLPASGKFNDAGARTWSLNELPADLREKLSRRRKAANFASDDDWVSSQRAWQPKIPFAELSARLRDPAIERCRVLAPILAKFRDESVSRMIDAAKRSYLSEGLRAPNERTLRRWIESAAERDNCRGEFGRPELYLCGSLVRAPRRKDRSEDGALSSVASWDEACRLYSSLIAEGETSGSSGNKVRRIISGSPLGAGMSADAIRKALSRKIGRWITGSTTLMDRRKDASGRKAKFDLNEREVSALRWYRLRKVSLHEAIVAFSIHPRCRPETRALIHEELDSAARDRRKAAWPLSLRRAGEVSLELQGRFRSNRALREVGYGVRRGNFWVNDAGEEVALLPNTLWESDDMSVNEPFRFVDPETGENSLGRQVLVTIDVFTAAFLGESPIGRSKDAYRAEDIADHMRDCVLQHGLPSIWRLERGAWENKFIDGFRLADGSLWGGLADIIKIQRTFGPQAKGLIESRFNQLQRLMAHESTSIGRKRGEFADATRLAYRARNGDVQAWQKFWDIAAAADGIERAMLEANLSQMQRRAFGKKTVVPAELYRLAAKKACPDDQLWRFCPIKRPATVRKCAVEVTVDHYPLPFRFRVNGDDDPYLPHGYSVLIAFHPGHPERGCHIFNGEQGVRNTQGFRRHEFIRVAPIAEDSPQVNYSRDEQEFIKRKRANAQVASEFRAITLTGTESSRASTRRDGFGNSVVRAVGPARIENERARGLVNRQDPRSRRADEIIKAARSDFDEEAALLQVQRLEREAIARGDILPL